MLMENIRLELLTAMCVYVENVQQEKRLQSSFAMLHSQCGLPFEITQNCNFKKRMSLFSIGVVLCSTRRNVKII